MAHGHFGFTLLSASVVYIEQSHVNGLIPSLEPFIIKSYLIYHFDHEI